MPDELLRLVDAIRRDLAHRDEAAEFVHVGLEAAFVVAGDAGFDHHSLGHLRPIADIDRPAGERQFDQPLFRIKPDDDRFDDRADFRRRGELP